KEESSGPHGAKAPRAFKRAKEKEIPPAGPEVLGPRSVRGNGFAARAARFLRQGHRQPALGPLFRPRSGQPHRPDALGKPAEPPGAFGLAGPRHNRAQIRLAPAYSPPGPQ